MFNDIYNKLIRLYDHKFIRMLPQKSPIVTDVLFNMGIIIHDVTKQYLITENCYMLLIQDTGGSDLANLTINDKKIKMDNNFFMEFDILIKNNVVGIIIIKDRSGEDDIDLDESFINYYTKIVNTVLKYSKDYSKNGTVFKNYCKLFKMAPKIFVYKAFTEQFSSLNISEKYKYILKGYSNETINRINSSTIQELLDYSYILSIKEDVQE